MTEAKIKQFINTRLMDIFDEEFWDANPELPDLTVNIVRYYAEEGNPDKFQYTVALDTSIALTPTVIEILNHVSNVLHMRLVRTMDGFDYTSSSCAHLELDPTFSFVVQCGSSIVEMDSFVTQVGSRPALPENGDFSGFAGTQVMRELIDTARRDVAKGLATEYPGPVDSNEATEV
ncbi:MAG: hypothetical protein ACK5XN_35050 [Bacteroidota bacterium]